MLRVGVIGCGTIGSEICKAINKNLIQAELAGICDIDLCKAKSLAETLHRVVQIMAQSDLMDSADLIVEATCLEAAPNIIRGTLLRSKDVIVMSVGGLLPYFEELRDLAKEKQCLIYVPSGAIAGLDALKGAREAEITKVVLTTKKPPKGLEGAPYVVENHIELKHLKQATEIFSGTALEAVPAFPANINVAAALSLAGIGAKETQVKIIADPFCSQNIHEIEIEGEFGRLFTRIELMPSPYNPRTSLLAALSAIALLRRITDSVIVGT